MKPSSLPELVVHDEEGPCPYLPHQRARLPFRLPRRPPQPAEFDQLLAAGDRRHSVFFYRPTCRDCVACEAIRIDVSVFAPSRSQRRILHFGDAHWDIRWGTPAFSEDRLALYRAHVTGRGLGTVGAEPLSREAFRQFFLVTSVETGELTVWTPDRLLAVAVFDAAATALSLVYCYYDPACTRGLGTYAILKQIERARGLGLRYVYLGLYIEACRAMNYKARFRPHERLINGVWRGFD